MSLKLKNLLKDNYHNGTNSKKIVLKNETLIQKFKDSDISKLKITNYTIGVDLQSTLNLKIIFDYLELSDFIKGVKLGTLVKGENKKIVNTKKIKKKIGFPNQICIKVSLGVTIVLLLSTVI